VFDRVCSTGRCLARHSFSGHFLGPFVSSELRRVLLLALFVLYFSLYRCEPPIETARRFIPTLHSSSIPPSTGPSVSISDAARHHKTNGRRLRINSAARDIYIHRHVNKPSQSVGKHRRSAYSRYILTRNGVSCRYHGPATPTPQRSSPRQCTANHILGEQTKTNSRHIYTFSAFELSKSSYTLSRKQESMIFRPVDCNSLLTFPLSFS